MQVQAQAIIVVINNGKDNIRVAGQKMFNFINQMMSEGKKGLIDIPQEYIDEHMFFTGAKPVKKQFDTEAGVVSFIENCSFHYSNQEQAKNVVERVGKVSTVVSVKTKS